MKNFPIILFILLYLTGCGQSGPLYLPTDPQNTVDIQTPTNRELF